MREWLSWWSATLPRSRPRVRVPSRALFKKKKDIHLDVFFLFTWHIRASKVRGLSPHKVGFGRRRAEVPRTSCTVSHSVSTISMTFTLAIFSCKISIEIEHHNKQKRNITTNRNGIIAINSNGYRNRGGSLNT